jgi:tRNA pseudouridine38-40 synthase
VAGTLAAALAQVAAHEIAGDEIGMTCAGRTDSGVHALAQVVHVDLDERLGERIGLPGRPGTELPALARSLTSISGPGIVVWRAVVATIGFDARRSATGRRYRYDVEIGERADPLRRGSCWHVGAGLDLAVVRLATDPVIGEHDFAAFCRRPPGRRAGPITRRVAEASWTERGDGVLRFEIEAGSFCHQMVRSLVGAFVAAGEGRMRPSDVVTLLRSGSRAGAPTIAPPHGLCLVAVRYPDTLGGDWC